MALHVDIVTPEKSVFSGSARELRAPGINGQFGVLEGHTFFLSLLQAGVLTVVGEGGDALRFIIGRGFAEAGSERVVILTDSCEDAASVDKGAASAALEAAELALANEPVGSEAWLSAEREAELSRARIEA